MFFKMAKQIGAADQTKQSEIKIECIENLTAQEQVQAVADSMAEVSNLNKPVDLSKLPSYLPANNAPQVELYIVVKQIQNQKKTHRTLKIDLPASLRKEAAKFLAEPFPDILNSSLHKGIYPQTWKFEWCTPVPKK